MNPISRRGLIRRLRRFGFDGPFHGRKHGVMDNGYITVRIPNPHPGDISVGLLKEILRQAGISNEEWESTK